MSTVVTENLRSPGNRRRGRGGAVLEDVLDGPRKVRQRIRGGHRRGGFHCQPGLQGREV